MMPGLGPCTRAASTVLWLCRAAQHGEMAAVAYRQAIMADMVAGRLYKEADLKRLFWRYQSAAPLHDKQVGLQDSGCMMLV
jgi:hypothetical protein